MTAVDAAGRVPATARDWAGGLARYRLAVDLLPLAVVLALVALAHGFNIANYPYYENDEGTYVSQAWAVLSSGRLAPYTYWYDHAPLGWIQLAAWTLLTGGFERFGTSIESARIFMLVLQVASTYLLYRIARQLTGSVVLGLLAAALFGLSAYGIYYHRRVLLDNIATFWLLASIAMIVIGRPSLRRIWLSALALSISVLSKEVTAFVVPAMAYLAYLSSGRTQRPFATVGWVAITGATISLYALMATLKGELFPSGTLFGGDTAHVSLLGSLQLQAGRRADGGLFEAGSEFWTAITLWIQQEPLLILGGAAASAMLLLRIRHHRVEAVMALLAVSLMAFIARGGVVLAFYLLPILPLFALNISLAVKAIVGMVPRWRQPPLGSFGLRRELAMVPLAVVLTLGLGFGYAAPGLGLDQDPFRLWRGREAVAQRQAVDWVTQTLTPTSAMIIDNYLWTDLRLDASFDLAHYYWKAEYDPEIRDGVFENDWHNVDYLVVTGQASHDARNDGFAFVGSTLDNSSQFAVWDTGGWMVEARRVNKFQRVAATTDAMLIASWRAIEQHLIEADGRVGPSASASATALTQGLAMQAAVYMNDRAAFDIVRDWTDRHLRMETGLHSEEWTAADGGVSRSATESDVTIASALALGGIRWNDASLTNDAAVAAAAIWDHETVDLGAVRVPLAGSWAAGETRLLSSAALLPHAYRLFASVDPDHPWQAAVEGSYLVALEVARSEELGGGGVPPDWLALRDGKLEHAVGMVPRANESSAQASRFAFNLAVDLGWSGDERAAEVLAAMRRPAEVAAEWGYIPSRLDLAGAPKSDAATAAGSAGWIAALAVGGSDAPAAHRLLATEVLGPTVGNLGDPPQDALTWLLGWRTTALLDGGFANLAAGDHVIRWEDAQPSALLEVASD
jgi:endo-1,4-beta-D-glucanase Y/4-amino-4-deoxy-L-arabinose transferase-like glycosyltransferase